MVKVIRAGDLRAGMDILIDNFPDPDFVHIKEIKPSSHGTNELKIEFYTAKDLFYDPDDLVVVSING